MRFLLFGRDEDFDIDAAWWPLWQSEEHTASTSEAALSKIRERLLEGGEEQYVELAAVPFSAFIVERFSDE